MALPDVADRRPTAGRAYILLGVVGLALVLAFGWYKSFENEQYRAALQAWRERIAYIEDKIPGELARTNAWTNSVRSAPDVRDQVAAKFPGAKWKLEGNREVAEWTSPETGLWLQFTFDGGHLVSNGARYGTVLVQQRNPAPPDTASRSRAESIRRSITPACVWLWAAMVFVAIGSNRLRQLAVVSMIVLAVTCGAAWLVDPQYSLTRVGNIVIDDGTSIFVQQNPMHHVYANPMTPIVGGTTSTITVPLPAFSNDRLFWAALMIVQTVIVAAFLLRLEQTASGTRRRFRFTLRALLALVAVVCMLLAMGPFGYVALGTIGVATPLFVVTRRMASRIRRAMGLPGDVPLVMDARAPGA